MSYADVIFLTAADRRYFLKVASNSATFPIGPEWRADEKLRGAELIRIWKRAYRSLTDAGYSILTEVQGDVQRSESRPYEVKR